MHEEYLTIKDAATRLDIGVSTLWKWLKLHEMQTYRFMGDRKTYIRVGDLEKLRGPVPVGFQTKKAAARHDRAAA
jgi:excisionase family DNA binding protein